MFLTATLLCASLLLADDSAARKELAAAAAKVVAAPNYTTVYDDGSAAEIAGDPHVGETPDPKAVGAKHKKTSLWTIQWSKEQPTHLTRGRAEFWRLGKRYIALGRDDEWVVVELPDPKQHAELRGMARMAFDLERLQLPHLLLNGVERKLASVTRTERDGKVCFEGPLEAKLARQMLGGPKEPPAKEPPAKDAQHDEPPKPIDPAQSDPASEKTPPPPAAPEYSGKLRVVVAAGVVESIELELTLSGTPDARQWKRRFDVAEIGTTKIDVPAPASKLLHDE